MKRGAIYCSMVLVLAALALPAGATGVDPGDDEGGGMAAFRQKQVELFDALSSDASPRRQMLAGQVYIPDADEVPSALRPKREDVVTRAALFAAGDAFVQWFAASEGSYTSSACGPTRWPEAEVANLASLEPDNATTWQYAAALANAKNDQAGVDNALARLSAAARAEDHGGDLLAEWTAFYAVYPQFADADFSADATAAPQAATALRSALQHVSGRSTSASSSLEAACKPNPDSDRIWQRISGCVDAGHLLATRGNSLDLRELGLKLLAAAGDRSDETAELQRQYDWLATNSANPWRNFTALQDDPADLLADWNGTRDEIVATKRRLRRHGLSLQAPAGWSKPADAGDREDADEKNARELYTSYLGAIVQTMRSSTDARQQVIGERALALLDLYTSGDSATASAARATSKPRLGEIADAHADDALVLWLTATASVGEAVDATTHARAVANLQRVEADNAAAWALGLAEAAAPSDTLARMANSNSYDNHLIDVIRVTADALRALPPPEELLEYARKQMPDGAFSADDYAGTLALTIATTTLNPPYKALLDGCKQADHAAECTSIGRLMMRKSGTLLDAYMGQQILRQTSALDADDAEFMRRVEWWQQSALSPDAGVFRDILSTGDEIEAIRLLAVRAGKAEPPQGWIAPSAKRAAAAAARAAGGK